MAKNSFDGKFIGLLSFIALIVWGVCRLIAELGGNAGALAHIGTICLIVATFLSAWNFVYNKAQVWKIIYFVLLIFVILMYLWPHIFK